MILLDADVVSTVMAPVPPRLVLDWLNLQETVTLYLSTITIAEIGYSLRVLPDGKRRQSLQNRFESFVAKGFEQRVLSFDESAGRLYGEIMGHRQELGRPLGARRLAIEDRTMKPTVHPWSSDTRPPPQAG